MHVFCAAVLFAISLGDGASSAGVPKDGVLEFDIVRNGEAIGTHTYLFDRSANRTEVRIKTEINFRLFFISVYLFYSFMDSKIILDSVLREPLQCSVI